MRGHGRPWLATQCSVDDCDITGKMRRGLCGMHYQRLKVKGLLAPMPSPAERLAAQLVRTPNGCLEWVGSTNTKGYGQLCVDGKGIGTHRLSWILTNGPIPDGVFICHACDNPPCCDPEHLFLGTNVDNMADMVAKGRSRNGSDGITLTHCPQGHEYTEANTYTDPGHGYRHCRTCKRDNNRQRRMRVAS